MKRPEAPKFNATGLRVFATCPPSSAAPRDRYLEMVARVAGWSEASGCEGLLVYTDNRLVDPWLLAQRIIARSSALQPLIAVQPSYMHPYAVAKMVSSIAFFSGRRVGLNMVAGGFKNDLEALGDPTAHDERYERLCEYTEIVLELIRGRAPVTRTKGRYRVTNLLLLPPMPEQLLPAIFVSGSSAPGLDAAQRLGAVAVCYPPPAAELGSAGATDDASRGIRIGIIARDTTREAWTVARTRFPDDRRGRLAHQLATKVSDSEWHRQLSAQTDESQDENDPYWLVPFKTYSTFCPYLVGNYERVGAELARYMRGGCRTFILDVPQSADDLRYAAAAFACAAEVVTV